MRLKYIQADMSTGVKEPVDDFSQKKSRRVDFPSKCIRLLLANWKMCSRIGIYPLPPSPSLPLPLPALPDAPIPPCGVPTMSTMSFSII